MLAALPQRAKAWTVSCNRDARPLKNPRFGRKPRFLRPGCSIIRASLPFANIGVLRAGRAQPLYLLTPAGRFALRATAHRADASLRCASGRFGPSAQVPTGHALPFAPAGVWGGVPNSCAAAQKRERFEWPKVTRNAGRFHIDGVRGMPGAQRARRRKPPGRGRRDRGGGVRTAGRAGTSWREHWDGARGFGADGVSAAAECGRRDELPGRKPSIYPRI